MAKMAIIAATLLLLGSRISAFSGQPSTFSVRESRATSIATPLNSEDISAVDSSSSTVEAEASPSLTTSFVSPLFQCYIEDTDSYGVMHNANYLRSFDRALHSMYALQDTQYLNEDGSSAANGDASQKRQRSMLDTHEDWSIVHVTNQKFKSSPALGGIYCIHGSLVEHQEDLEVWDLAMHASVDPQSTMFNSARATIARPGVFAQPAVLVQDIAKNTDDDGDDDGRKKSRFVTSKDIFRLFRDEFDVHFPSHIPLRNCLTIFERSRSNFLGGPDNLRKLKEDHGLLFVVTKVDDCCKFPTLPPSDDGSKVLAPGQLVLVQTDFEVKRKGMIIECHHALMAKNRLVAQGMYQEPTNL